MGKSAVLVVYFPGKNQPHQLLLLDSVPAWDLVFDSDSAFNEWAEERYRWITEALKSIGQGTTQAIVPSEAPELVRSLLSAGLLQGFSPPERIFRVVSITFLEL